MRENSVSFVVPVHNAGPRLNDVLAALLAQSLPDVETEIIAVDDASTDGSAALLKAREGIRVIVGEGRGASAAINLGVRAAKGAFICQVDQDVVVSANWLASLWNAIRAEPDVGAVQGIYVAEAKAGLWARVMALDLRQRYQSIPGNQTNHVCTGITLYRRDALEKAGPFDEELGYANDNDMSYRLGAAGFSLRLCRAASAIHFWRDSLAGYWQQQYGQGYGRLELLTKHPKRVTGDQVSGPLMMLHAPIMFVALLCLGGGLLGVALGLTAPGPWLAGCILLGALFLERLVAGVQAAIQFRDPVGLAFPIAHLIRDVAWSAAIVRWLGRTLTGRARSPAHSMRR